MKNTTLENKLLFRLVKVVYVLTLLAGVLILTVLSWAEKPTPYIDTDKSIVTCSNGKNYSFSTAGIYYLSPSDSVLDKYDVDEASKFCMENYVYLFHHNNTPDITERATYSQLSYYGLSVSGYPEAGKFTYSIAKASRGSWQSVILWWIGGFMGIYIVLNLIRETLNYILFGRPFQWDWITKIISFYQEKDKNGQQ